MSTDKELANRSAEQAKFAKLIEEDFQDRSLGENKIIKAKIIEIIRNNPPCKYSNSVFILKDKAKTMKYDVKNKTTLAIDSI